MIVVKQLFRYGRDLCRVVRHEIGTNIPVKTVC